MKNLHKSNAVVQEITTKCLEFLIADPNKLFDFCQQNGSDISDIKANLENLVFQASLFDHFLNNQSLAFDLFKAKSINPKEFIKARYQLPGADIELISL